MVQHFAVACQTVSYPQRTSKTFHPVRNLCDNTLDAMLAFFSSVHFALIKPASWVSQTAWRAKSFEAAIKICDLIMILVRKRWPSLSKTAAIQETYGPKCQNCSASEHIWDKDNHYLNERCHRFCLKEYQRSRPDQRTCLEKLVSSSRPSSKYQQETIDYGLFLSKAYILRWDAWHPHSWETLLFWIWKLRWIIRCPKMWIPRSEIQLLVVDKE